jgi:hypothetical protein
VLINGCGCSPSCCDVHLVVLAQLVLAQVLNLTNQPQRVVAQAVDTSRSSLTKQASAGTDAFAAGDLSRSRRYKPAIFKPDMLVGR